MPRVRHLLPLLLAAGCYDFDRFLGPPSDGAVIVGDGATPPPDFSVLSVPADLTATMADGAGADLVTTADHSMAMAGADLSGVDLAMPPPPPDLATRPDLTPANDLTLSPDLSVTPDLVKAADLATPPDLTLVCDYGYADCDGNAGNGCETSIGTDAKNCGACGNGCGGGTVCWNLKCIAKPKVLYVHADFKEFATDVQSKLSGTGHFAAVDLFDARQATPSANALGSYSAVLVASNFAFADATTLGDNLATYYDNGGRVVVAVFSDANGNAGYAPRGRFSNGGYGLLSPFTYDDPPPLDQLGQLVEPQSPLLWGVSQFASQRAWRSNGGIANGAVVVARWKSGKPLIVRGTVKNRTRVDLNFFPTSADGQVQPPDMNGRWVGDGANLLRNALLMQ